MGEDKQDKPVIRIKLQGLDKIAAFWRAFGRGSRRAAVFVFKALKWPLLIALPVVIFLISAWLSLLSSLSSDVKTVPDLINMYPEQAREQLSVRSLKLAINEKREFSDWHDEGTVTAQEPGLGARIKRGRTVHVTLSAGPRNVLVPNLQGMSLREAQLIAEQKGFKLRRRLSIYSDIVQEGCVIAQSPQPSTAFVTESIDVLESKGPRPRLALIPRMEGQPLLPVLDLLRSEGVKVLVFARGSSEEISNRDRFELRRCVIYRQSPKAGLFIQLPSSEEVILRVDWSGR